MRVFFCFLETDFFCFCCFTAKSELSPSLFFLSSGITDLLCSQNQALHLSVVQMNCGGRKVFFRRGGQGRKKKKRVLEKKRKKEFWKKKRKKNSTKSIFLSFLQFSRFSLLPAALLFLFSKWACEGGWGRGELLVGY